MTGANVEGPSAPQGPASTAERRTETFWGWVRVTARLWGFLAFILVILIIFRSVILPFAIALLVTYVLAPVLRRLSALRIGGRKMPRALWLIGLYLVLIGLLTLVFIFLVPRLSNDLKRIVREVPPLTQKIKHSWLPTAEGWLRDNFGDETAPQPGPAAQKPSRQLQVKRLPDGTLQVDPQGLELEVIQTKENSWLVRAPGAARQAPNGERFEGAVGRYLRELVATSEGKMNQVVRLGQRFVLGLMHALTTFILVLMISAFLLLDTERILGWLRNLIPPSYHGDFDKVVTLIDRGLSGAIRGQLLICLVNGVLTGIGLVLIGVKYSLILAVLAGVLSLIPIFGSIISSIPIVAVALVSGEAGVDLPKGVLMLIWIIGIHLLEANLLNPKIIGTAARIHPVIVIFAVVAGQRTYGATGALLAVPIVSAVQALFVYIRARVRREGDPGAAERQLQP